MTTMSEKDMIIGLKALTKAGLLDCQKAVKKSLESSDHSFLNALDCLKINGIEKAKKKLSSPDRVIKNTCVFMKEMNGKFIILCYQTETDFAILSTQMQDFILNEAHILAYSYKKSEQLDTFKDVLSTIDNAEDRLNFFAYVMNEKIVLADQAIFEKHEDRKFIPYLHAKNENCEYIGKSGVVIEVNSNANEKEAMKINYQLTSKGSEDFLNQKFNYDQSKTIQNFLTANDIKLFNYKCVKF